MSIFQLKQNSLSQIKEMPFKLEREIQGLVEKNLDILLGLEFVKSEFTISGTVQQLRIDTLAFDLKNKAFVIIEYKQDKSFSVVDQGYAYLSVMLNNKADFILEYNESCGKVLKKADVDWSQSRVIFISQAFTPYQKEAINFKDLPIALWEIKQFSNQTISFEEIRKLNATESIKTVSAGNSAVDSVSKVVVVYTENDRLKDIPEDILELYGQLRERILELGNVEIKATKLYVAFTVNGSNFTDIAIQKKALKLWINLPKGGLEDPYKLARDVANIGHHGNGDYQLSISNADKLDYIITLIKQGYQSKV
ncbi:MAG: hypothetical protein HP002_06435 [Lentisphaeria bacterium]|nr:hypothetical protein [Lentisphaeria bacterium]